MQTIRKTNKVRRRKLPLHDDELALGLLCGFFVPFVHTVTHDEQSQAAAAADYDSEELDEPEDSAPTTKKRKLTAEAKLKAKEKAKAKKSKKGGDGDDDDEDEEQDAYTALSKMWSGGDAKPPVGSFEDCAKCETQFTVVRTAHYMHVQMLIELVLDQVHDGCGSWSWFSLLPLRQSVWV